MHARLDDLLTAIYVAVDDFLPRRTGPGRPLRISDGELICLAIAQIGLRLLALAAGLWHNAQIGKPGRNLAAYGR